MSAVAGRNTDDPNERMRAFMAHKGPRRPPIRRAPPKPPVEIAIGKARRAAATGDWSNASGSVLVGLYAFCHEQVYGVRPVELDDKGAMRTASRMASQLVAKHFDDDFAQAAAFVRWSWLRERSREEWAKREGKERGRLSWKLQFGPHFVTDYRVDQSRKKSRR